MPIQLHEPQFEELVHGLRCEEVSQFGLRGYLSAGSLPGDAGNFRVAHACWGEVFKFYRFDYDMADDFELVLAANRDNRLTFFIDGGIDMRALAGPVRFDLSNGNAMLRSSHAGEQFVVKVPRARRHSVVQLRVERTYFDRWLAESDVRVGEAVMDDLHTHDGRVAYSAGWSGQVETCLRQMVGCELRGVSRLSYLGAKSLELLTLFGQQLDGGRTSPRQRHAERVGRAHDLLVSDLTRAPTVEALARSVNWNVSDLQAAFKARYGLPVHAYLRAARLRQAAELLATTDRSVLDVALDTGWHCPSRFGSAFRRQYGHSPTGFREQARTKASASAPR